MVGWGGRCVKNCPKGSWWGNDGRTRIGLEMVEIGGRGMNRRK